MCEVVLGACTDLGADHGRAQVERVATLGRDPLALDANKLFDALEQLLLIERLLKGMEREIEQPGDAKRCQRGSAQQ